MFGAHVTSGPHSSAARADCKPLDALPHGATIEGEHDGDITELIGFLDRQVISTSWDNFDSRGNALIQQIDTYYEDSLGEIRLYQTQNITNDPFDFHDRTYHVSITTTAKDYIEGEEVVYDSERQEIYTLEYDRYNNALSQKI